MRRAGDGPSRDRINGIDEFVISIVVAFQGAGDKVSTGRGDKT
jgi:hypothetical protein